MKKVLIIDDEKDIREILEEIFKSEYSFDETKLAQDALEAFYLCKNEKFDLICLDHHMPYMYGAEFLLALREKDSLNKETPVMFISAYIPELSERHKSVENTFFLEKPVDFSRLGRYVKMATMKKE